MIKIFILLWYILKAFNIKDLEQKFLLLDLKAYFFHLLQSFAIKYLT